ncbi:MAG: DMT family transporter [Saprospiraceae bacterium]|nr:DMT family transporter [Lewinella sp.]
MNPTQRSYTELHLAVFLFGFTAILGDLITLPALGLVWWRAFLTATSFLFLISVRKLFMQTERRTIYKFMGIGILVGLHWLCFFGAVKLANPSITLVCMATASFFTSLLEPLFTKAPVKWYEIALGVLIVPGMILIVNSAELSMMWGIVIGLTASVISAVFAILNKMLIGRLHVREVSFLELGTAFLFLSLVLPIYQWSLPTDEKMQLWPTQMDWLYLIFLALVCTTLGYLLALRSLRHLTAFASNLTVNLEPVYGIIMAYFLLDDRQELDPHFYWGALIIIMSVFAYPVLRKWNKRN